MQDKKRKPLLIVIAGPNGSGKTTLTRLLIRHEWGKDCLYINPDVIAQQKYGNWNDVDAVIKAAKEATQLREKCLAQRVDFMFETVFSTSEKVIFLEKAKKNGFFIRFFFVCTENPTINAARVAQRVMQGGHTVPIEKIIDRYFRSIAQAGRVLHKVDRMYFFDNSVNSRPPQLVFRIYDEKIKVYQQKMPEWARLFHAWAIQKHREVEQDVAKLRQACCIAK